MFPAVVHARRRNIRSPDRIVNDSHHRLPSDGIMPHSLSPRKSASSDVPSPHATAVGSSWMLRRVARSAEHAESAAQEHAEKVVPTASSTINPSQLRYRRGHYGFNANSHTNDRAVALACVTPAALCRSLHSHARSQVSHSIAPISQKGQGLACDSPCLTEHKSFSPQSSSSCARSRTIWTQR